MNSRHYIGYSPLAVAALVAEASQILKIPTMDELIDEAASVDLFEDWGHRIFCAGPQNPRGCLLISETEAVELGIPARSERGHDPLWSGVYVDRRCLKRYRRKAGRR